MNTPKVSVICPIYNAEKTLCRMLNSLKAQTMTNFEVLMIDDGSNDSSGLIVDRYASLDKRFKAIHKQNAGVAAARQTGLEIASGEFIIHADSDDWIDSTMLEKMYETAVSDSADMVICNYYNNTDDSQKEVMQKPTDVENNMQTICDLFVFLHGNCWNKLIRHDIIDKYKISFFPGINYCEDLLFNIQLLKLPIRVLYFNEAFYHYYADQKHKSIVGGYSKALFSVQMNVLKKLECILPENIKVPILIKYKIAIKHGAFEHPIFSRKEYQNIFPEINIYILDEPYTKIEKMLFYFSFKGFYRTCTLLFKLKLKIRGNFAR